MLHPAQESTVAPLGRITALMARPSGMLWTAMAMVIRAASFCPPPKATPTATPSEKEWMVITAMTRSTRRAPAPRMFPNRTSLP